MGKATISAYIKMQSTKDFWNERAQLGEKAGTQDLILKQLEHRAILAEVNRLQPKRILEVGCGRGELAREILSSCLWVEQYDACDNSERMIAQVHKEWRPRHLDYYICEIEDLPPGPYDCVITERMLINLPNDDAQRAAIEAFTFRLVSGGAYLMCEHFKAGLDAINVVRRSLGLPYIAEPWHNNYVVPPWTVGGLGYLALCHERSAAFSAAYYFLSRIVNAQMAKLAGKDPDYNSRINQLALSLPADCVDQKFAMARLWTWRKA